MAAIKTAVDSVYAYKFIRLMQKDFSDWKAFGTGIIDAKGNVLKRPSSPEEKESYTPFHASIRSMKRMMSTVPGLTGISSFMSGLSAVASRYGINEEEERKILEALDLIHEEMVAGDSGGSTQNIASGVTTGAITNKGPVVIGKKRKRLKVNTNKL